MATDPVVAALRGGRSGYVLHPNADVDCLSAAAVLADIFGGELIAFEGLSKLARRFAAGQGIAIREDAPAGLAPLVAVDWSAPERVPIDLAERIGVVIDHHPNDPWSGAANRIDPACGSACEVVWDLLSESDTAVNDTQILWLQAGLLTDTGMLKHALPRTLRTVADLSERVPLDRAYLALGDGELDRSARIARLKAGSRLRFEEYHGLILAWSEVSSHEAHAARGLLALGADVAWVFSQREGRYRLSGRLAPSARDRGLALDTILSRLRTLHGCAGGGHPAAASATGVGIGEAMVRVVFDLIKEELTGQER